MDIQKLEKLARRVAGRKVKVQAGAGAFTDGQTITVIDTDVRFPRLPKGAQNEMAEFLTAHEAGHLVMFERVSRKLGRPMGAKEFYEEFADPLSPGADSRDYVRFLMNVVEDRLVDEHAAKFVGQDVRENVNRFFVWNRQGGTRPSIAELESRGSAGKCAAFIEAIFQLELYNELIESFFSPALLGAAKKAVEAIVRFGQGALSRQQALQQVLDALRKYCPPPWKMPSGYQPPKAEGAGKGGDPAASPEGGAQGQGQGKPSSDSQSGQSQDGHGEGGGESGSGQDGGQGQPGQGQGQGEGSGSGDGEGAEGQAQGEGQGKGGEGDSSEGKKSQKQKTDGKSSADDKADGESSDSEEKESDEAGEDGDGESSDDSDAEADEAGNGETADAEESEGEDDPEAGKESPGGGSGSPSQSDSRGTETGGGAGTPQAVERTPERRFEDNNLEALLRMLEKVLAERANQTGRGIPRWRTWSPGDVLDSEGICRYEEDEFFGIDPLKRRVVRRRDKEQHLVAVFIDSSGSVNNQLFSQLYRVVGELAEKVGQTEGVKLGVGQFSGGASWVLVPTQNASEIRDFAELEPQRLYSGGTTVGEIYGLLPDDFGGYESADLIVLTDGYVEDGKALATSLERSHSETGCEIKLHGVVFKGQGSLKQFKRAKDELPEFVRTWHLGGEE